MLVMFNESNVAWRHANITNRVSKLVCSRVLKDESVKYMDILYSNELPIEDLTNNVNMTECKVLYDGSTNVNFQRKDLKPFISKNEKNNTDILLVTVNLKGKILKNVVNTRAAILSYMIAKGEITFAVSLRDMGEGCKFEFICHDYTLLQDTTYTFVKNEDVSGYSVNIETEQVEDVIMKPTYKIQRFRPNRVTHLVFVSGHDEQAFYDVYANSDRHELCVFNSVDELSEKAEDYFKSGYRAATLFINDTKIDDEDSDVKIIRNRFRTMNILLNTGKIVFKR